MKHHNLTSSWKFFCILNIFEKMIYEICHVIPFPFFICVVLMYYKALFLMKHQTLFTSEHFYKL